MLTYDAFNRVGRRLIRRVSFLFFPFFFYAQKIISVLLKDLDVFARNSIQDELASLDPLLRNVGGWGAPSGTYEFDPS